MLIVTRLLCLRGDESRGRMRKVGWKSGSDSFGHLVRQSSRDGQNRSRDEGR